MAWAGKLTGFSDFYQVSDPSPEPEATIEDHIAMMKERGEGGPPSSD